MASKVAKRPSRYVNIQVNGLPSPGASENPGPIPKPHPLESHVSDPCIKIGESPSSTTGATPSISTNIPRTSTDAKSEQAIRDAKFKLLLPGVADKGECQQCQELSQLLTLWELGVGGIARNCSKILAQLNQAREAHQALEYRLQEKAEVESSAPVTKSLNVTSRVQKSIYRKSLHAEQGGGTSASNNGTAYLAEQMYPPKETELRLVNNSTECVSRSYEHYLQTLNTHLGQAIDLCQQLAAACFKSNQSVAGSSSAASSGSGGVAAAVGAGERHHLRRQPTAPAIKSTTSPAVSRSSKTPVTTNSSPHPAATAAPLQSVDEEKSSNKHPKTGSFTRARSSPGIYSLNTGSQLHHAESDPKLHEISKEKERITKTMISSSEMEEGWIKVAVNGNSLPSDKEAESEDSSDRSSSAVSSASRSPVHNPLLSVLGVTEQKKLAKEAAKSESDERPELVLSTSSTTSDHVRDSILSTYSDSDVKQVMSKIASLEEERIKLLDTIDKLHHQNQLVHQSLGDIFGDLQSKDLQLTLAMQDLSIATEEIKQAAEFRSRLECLEREKAQLTEHLSNLEDESAAVKVSLIRLLQEKSATNKTLALENWRLTQRMRQMSVRKLSRHGPGSASSPGAEGDNISVNSGFSTFNEDAGLQETYIGFDDSGHFVHKQGFLTKQGAKVKSWKKRLFVLNTDGLAYFKTEQPIQTIPLEKIDKVQVCHGRTVQPHMFEVHTQGRIFFLSASSEDEMQSWVGMLQTLKQYSKVTAQAQIQAQALAQQAKTHSSKAEGQAASQQQQLQQSQQKTAESADVKSSKDDNSSPQLHRKVVQSEASELEPVNLPQVHHHQPLGQITSAPYGRNRLGETLSESEEPIAMKSVPTSPTHFGDFVDSHTSSKSDIIASLNLQV